MSRVHKKKQEMLPPLFSGAGASEHIAKKKEEVVSLTRSYISLRPFKQEAQDDN